MSVNKNYFTKTLLKWNSLKNTRAMPWKGEKDPYKIWLSEIILQQTRVEQGWDYYNRFVMAFPTVALLAKAPETKVYKLWEGLGYYSRCKNLIATAKLITVNYKGKFPTAYTDILNLKGVGPYTAAAIASFAYNLPYAVVDGNVFRVLSRFFGITTASNATEGKKIFTKLAQELLDKKQPGIYNQALMDFGALLCKPQVPLCTTCPLKNKCVAFKHGRVDELPVKKKKIAIKNRWYYYVIIIYKNKVLVRKRETKDIWQNLYEFVLHESSKPLPPAAIKNLPEIHTFSGKAKHDTKWLSTPYQQKLSHQTIHCRFIKITSQKLPDIKGYKLVALNYLPALPFPKIISSLLKDKNVSLNLK
jgi:A/G-specific adenine glycosylase